MIGGHQLEQRRVGLEQREELDAGRQVAEEEVEVQQRLVGRGGRAQRLQQARHQLGQKLARAGRRGGAIAAVMPAPHDAGRRRRIAEAERLQGRQRARIVVGAGEHQVAAGAGEARRLLEQVGVVAFDAMQAVEQVLLEGPRIRDSPGRWRWPPRRPRRWAGCGSAGRRPSAGGARPCAGSRRPRSARRRSAGATWPAAASARSVSQVARWRSAGLRPPKISCWVWAKNSISRMPPRPSLTLWPSTLTALPPR